MIQFAVGVHAFWASHTALLLGHLVALTALVGIWGALSKKDQPAEEVHSFHMVHEKSQLQLIA